MKLTVKDSRTSATLCEVAGQTVQDLKLAFVKQQPKYRDINRVFLSTTPPQGKTRGTTLDYSVDLSKGLVKDGDVILFKYLPPQIGWRTVFFWEYFGPMLTFPIMYLHSVRVLCFGEEAAALPITWVQHLMAALYTLHFLKRVLESVFLHSFSKDTMPWTNLIKNVWYYYLFGILIAYTGMHPFYTAPTCNLQIYGGAVAFLVCMLINFFCHIKLQRLRKPGERAYKIPYGFPFNLVSVPNYTFEILEWVSFTIAFNSFFGGLFTVAGAGQMTLWAIGKHRRYLTLFGDEYKKLRRKIIFPFLY